MTPAQAIEQAMGSGGDLHGTLRWIAILTIMGVLPALLVMMTSFTRILIVLSFTRQALGTPSIPPNALLLSLTLILTGITMAPTFTRSWEEGVSPYLEHRMPFEQAGHQAMQPFRDFMFAHVREKDLSLFVKATHAVVHTRDDVSTLALMSGFAISEVRLAFQMGFLLLVSFLVIDLVVASLLMAMGMIMVPPMTISLPLKILVFVLADGWHLVIRSLLQSFS